MYRLTFSLRRTALRHYGPHCIIVTLLLLFSSRDLFSQAIHESSLTDHRVAEQLGITVDKVRLLHIERGLSNEALISLPAEKLQRALWRLEHPKSDFPGEWAAFRLLQEQDEAGNVPVDGLPRAIQQMQAIRNAVARPARAAGIPVGPLRAPTPAVMPLTAGIDPGGWTWLGPGNIGGRTRSIVIHPTTPTTMWAGSVGGGVWKTTDGGATWAPLYDFMGSLAVSTLALDPTNSNVIYAGTGEGFFNADAIRGAGIFRSTDGGTTWMHLGSTSSSDFLYVNRLAFSANGDVLLAATRTGLQRSTDGGNTWTSLGSPVNIEILDADFHPTDSTRCIASGRGGAAFFSTDGGQTWTQAAGIPAVGGFAGRVEATYAAANPATVYVSLDRNSGEVYRSTDGGQTYALRNTGTNYLGAQGWYDNIVWAGATDTSNVVIVGGIDLYRSTDGGSTFVRISNWWQAPSSAHADHHAIVAHPNYNGTSNRTVFFGNDGGIYRATDVTTVIGTTGWQELNNNFGVTQFYGAAGHPATGKIVGGTQDNGTLVFTTAGGTEGWSTMFGGDGGWSAADPTDANFLYGEYVYLRIHRSTNGGVSSSYIYAGITDANSGTANFISPFILDPNNENTILGGASNLWRSTNVKAPTPSWTAVKASIGSNVSAIATHKGDSNVVWVGHNNGNVYKSANATAASPTWTRVDDVAASPLPNRFCTRVAIDPANVQHVYVTFGGYSSDNVWKTTDAGTTWTNIGTPLPAAPVRSVVVHPGDPNYVYLGTEVGVFASEDAGATWSPTNEGPTNCSVDELFFMNNNLVAVTHGRGLFSIDVSPPPISSGRWGFVWANNPAAASYTPSTTYAYNAAGGPVTITRSGVGRYSVRFAGLGGSGTPGGHVQVTAYGSDNHTAKVYWWNSFGSDFIAHIRCNNAAGALADGRYTVLVQWPPVTSPSPETAPSDEQSDPMTPEGAAPSESPLRAGPARIERSMAQVPGLPGGSIGRIGFVWANNAAAASYTPSTTYAYNAAGGPVTITRSGAGRYSVRFVGLGGSGSPGGNVQVTAYGADNHTAKVFWWNSFGSDFIAHIRCHNAAGALADSRYTVLVQWPPVTGPTPPAESSQGLGDPMDTSSDESSEPDDDAISDPMEPSTSIDPQSDQTNSLN